MDLTSPVLSNAHVRLEPLEEAHREPLRAVAEDESIWAYMPVRATGDIFDRWFDWSRQIHDARMEMVFAVRDGRDGVIAGSTRYLNIAAEHKRLEIGHTWYAPAVWGTAVNPACKRLLLTHAFEVMGANRVEIKCDQQNARSAAAIAKLGAKREGVLRHHMIMPGGRLRDTLMFSILPEEWPAVRAGLDARLAENEG